MYHVELRQFPRSLTRFNLSGQQVGAILVPWSEKEPVEVNGQSWDPKEATITIIEGPEIPVHRLSMGRGWPLAQRQGEEVTGRVLDEARRAVRDGSAYRQAEPAAEASATEMPATEMPATEMPATEMPATEMPAAEMPAARTPGTEAPETGNGDPLSAGVELAGLLGPDAARLLAAWRTVAGRTSGLSPSESLALAERELAGG